MMKTLLKLLKTFFGTDDAYAGFIIRVVLGLVMLAHGAQKLLGLFGGVGFFGTIESFISQGSPWIVAFLVIMGESFGALGLIVGFLTRFAAFGICTIMFGAIGLVHWTNGFFMNWFGNQTGEGFEYHILVIGMSVALMVAGAGRWSVDRAIAERIKHL